MNRLDIYDGTDEQSMKIGEVYGNSNNKLLESISSSGKSMFITFNKQHNWGNEKTEFEAAIKYNKIMSACQTRFVCLFVCSTRWVKYSTKLRLPLRSYKQ